MIWLLPFISASIGWLTNWIAVKMLFYPRNPINLGLFTVQGIFPKRRGTLAKNLGKVVGKELLNISELKEKLLEGKSNEAILKSVETRIDSFLDEGIKEVAPMIAAFVNESMMAKMKEMFMKEFEKSLPSIIESLFNEVESKVDIEKIVEAKVNNFSMAKFEEMLLTIMSKEFKTIELVGAILGFIIGLVQIGLMQIG